MVEAPVTANVEDKVAALETFKVDFKVEALATSNVELKVAALDKLKEPCKVEFVPTNKLSFNDKSPLFTFILPWNCVVPLTSS